MKDTKGITAEQAEEIQTAPAKRIFLNRQAILEAADIATEDVEVPEWGGWVKVKAMTGTERDAFEASLLSNAGTKHQHMTTANIRAKLVSKTVIDEDGEPIFTAGDIEALGRKSSAALDRVYEVASRLSKISEEDVEELAKN